MHTRERHHAFHVNVEKLCDTQEFQKNLEDYILSSVDNRLPLKVISFAGRADRKFLKTFKACLASAYSGAVEASYTEAVNMGSFIKSENFKNVLSEGSEQIIILDPLIISGMTRLTDFQIELRQVLKDTSISENFKFSKLRYLTALLRPSSVKKRDWLKAFVDKSSKGLDQYFSFDVIEDTILPDWGDDFCPWCAEHRSLKSVLDNSEHITDSEYAFLEKRVSVIAGRSGLIDSVFFKRHPSDDFQFGDESLFFNSKGLPHFTHSDVACAVASGLQNWRTQSPYDSALTAIIDEKTWSDPNTYNDPLLRASIWRALKLGDVDFPALDGNSGARAFMRDIMCSETEHIGPDETRQLILAGEAALFLGKQISTVLSEEDLLRIEWLILADIASA